MFCDSSSAVAPRYFAAARELGEKLARRGWALVYGGSGVGLAQIQRGIDERFIKVEYLDLWYPAPDVDAWLRYLEAYRPHGYRRKWW